MTDSEALARAEALKTLTLQAEQVGLKVNPNWKVETLSQKVSDALARHAMKEAAAIKKASDTWVYMLRDGFAVADEKLRTGGTFQVPEAIAERWYEAGVARPATRAERPAA